VGSADKRRSACGRRPRSEIIAAIALAISFESAVAAGVSLFLSFRESARRDEEIRLLRDEAGRREEELSLIRQQVERDREEREIAKRANLKMTPGSSSSSPQEITFDVLVANAGPHFASDLLVRLRDADGHIVGESSHREPLLAGAPSVRIAVHTPPPDRYTGPYDAELSWLDGMGRVIGGQKLSLAKP
jgi:hypothetical protein